MCRGQSRCERLPCEEEQFTGMHNSERYEPAALRRKDAMPVYVYLERQSLPKEDERERFHYYDR